MTNYIHLFYSLCCLAIGFALGSLIMTPAEGTMTLPPCATEDSTNCYWDAAHQGNGLGQSFIDWDGTTMIGADR